MSESDSFDPTGEIERGLGRGLFDEEMGPARRWLTSIAAKSIE